MPLVDMNLKANWDASYVLHDIDVTGRAVGTLGFERKAKARLLGEDHWMLRDALGLTIGQKIALIGAAYGFIAEDWIASGLSVVAVDTSTYIQSTKGTNATLTILNESGLTTASRNNILSAAGLANSAKFDWVITEDVLGVLSDNECTTLAVALRKFAVKVAHWVSVTQGSVSNANLNWKTLAQWKALMTPDMIIQRGGSTAI